MKTTPITMFLLGVSLIALLAQDSSATTITDKFTDASNWGTAVTESASCNLSVGNGRMNYTSSNMAYAGAVIPRNTLLLPTTQDWSLKVNAHVDGFNLTTDGQFSDVFLGVEKTGEANSSARFEFGRGKWGYFKSGYYIKDYVITAGVKAPELFKKDDLASSDVGLRIVYNAARCKITYYFDGDGASGGENWVEQGTANLGIGAYNLNMRDNDTFTVLLGGSSAFQTLAASQSFLTNLEITIDKSPVVVTGAPSAITASAATLNGTINPNGFSTAAWFEYGLTTEYGETASVSLSPDNGRTKQDSSAMITFLEKGRIYHYRLTAVNDGIVLFGDDMTFITPSVSGDGLSVEFPTESALIDSGVGIDYDKVFLGLKSSKTFTIRNISTASVSGLVITKDGPNAGDFEVGIPGATSLAPGTSTTFTVSFSPSSVGHVDAAIHVTQNNSGGNPFDINIGGTGVDPNQTIAAGIDLPGTTTTIDGGYPEYWHVTDDAAWFLQSDDTHDGIDAIRSGVLDSFPSYGRGKSSSFALKANGPGEVSFWWRSNANSDLSEGLSFYIDDIYQSNIKIGGWYKRSFFLGEGSHTLRWTYSSWENEFMDPGYAWVDQVVLPPANYYPYIVLFGDTTYGGGTYGSDSGFDFWNTPSGPTLVKSFTIKNLGVQNLTGLTITKSGPNADEFAVGPLNATALAPFASTTFTVAFAPGASGTRTASIQIASSDPNVSPVEIRLRAGDPVETIEDGVDIPKKFITSSGWSWQTAITHDGFDAVQSDDNPDNESPTFSLSAAGPGTVSFWWKVSSHPDSGHLIFYIDGVEQPGKISGAVDWQQKSYILGAGIHTLQWTYTKGAWVSGDDCGWVDQVTLPIVDARPEIVVEQPTGSSIGDGGSKDCGAVNIGAHHNLNFTIKNSGTGDLTGIKISKDGPNHSNFIVTSPLKSTLAPGAATTFAVQFAPTDIGTRKAFIHIVSNDADESPFDITLTGSGVTRPEIAVQQPAGTDLKDGISSKSFGSVALKSTNIKTFTIRNSGTANLTNLAITKSGTNAKDFTVTPPLKTTLPPRTKTTFKVTFKPSVKGTRKAAIHIKSNDSNESPFDIALTGKGVAKKAAPPALISAARLPSWSASGNSAWLAHDIRQTSGTVQLPDGRRYLTLTVIKSPEDFLPTRSVEVSPNLIDWFSGRKHITVITDDAARLKVRDNTPLTPGTKRYIRLNQLRQ
jgi:hypothetical protein